MGTCHPPSAVKKLRSLSNNPSRRAAGHEFQERDLLDASSPATTATFRHGSTANLITVHHATRRNSSRNAAWPSRVRAPGVKMMTGVPTCRSREKSKRLGIRSNSAVVSFQRQLAKRCRTIRSSDREPGRAARIVKQRRDRRTALPLAGPPSHSTSCVLSHDHITELRRRQRSRVPSRRLLREGVELRWPRRRRPSAPRCRTHANQPSTWQSDSRLIDWGVNAGLLHERLNPIIGQVNFAHWEVLCLAEAQVAAIESIVPT